MASASSPSSSSPGPGSAKAAANRPRSGSGHQHQYPHEQPPLQGRHQDNGSEPQYRQYPPHQLYYPPAPEHRPSPSYYPNQHHPPQPPPSLPPHSALGATGESPLQYPPASDHYGYLPSAPGSARSLTHAFQYQAHGHHPQDLHAGLAAGGAATGRTLSLSSSPSVMNGAVQQQPPEPFYPPPTCPSGASGHGLPVTPYPPLPVHQSAHIHAPASGSEHSHFSSQKHRQQQQHEQAQQYHHDPSYHHAYPLQHAAPSPTPYPSWQMIAPSPLPPQAGGATAGHFSLHSSGSSGQWSAHPTGPGTGRRTVTEAPLSLTQNAAQFKSPEHKRKVADYARLMLGADPDASPSFLPYRSFGEAVSLNPIYVSIGALSVYCTLCQKAFKMSTKCNLRFVQRHEQSLKHTDQLRKILAEYPPVDDAGNPISAPGGPVAAADSTAPASPSATDAQRAPPVDSAWSTAASSRASTSALSTPAASRPSSSSPPPSPTSPTSAAAASAPAPLASTANLGSSVIAKKAYLEESFVKHVEQNSLFTIVDETTVYCLPCTKRLKLDRARSPRTVLLHCASQVHLIKLNKYRLGEQTSAQQQVLSGAASSAQAPTTSGDQQEQPQPPADRRSPILPAIVTTAAPDDNQGHSAQCDPAGHGLVTPQSAAADYAQASSTAWPSAPAAPAAESQSNSPALRSPAQHQQQPQPLHPLPPADRRYILPLPTPTWPYTQPPSAHAPTFPQHHHHQPLSPNKHATPLQSPPPSATSWTRYQSAPALTSSTSSLSMSRRASPYPTATLGAVPLPMSVAAAPQLQSPPPARRSNSNSPASPAAACTAQGAGAGRISASPTGSSGSQSGTGGKKMSLQFLVD